MTTHYKILVYDPIKAPMHDIQKGLVTIQQSCAMAKSGIQQLARLCGVHWSMIPHNTTSNYYRNARQLRRPEKVPHNIYIENSYIRNLEYFSLSVGKANNLNCLKPGFEDDDSRIPLLDIKPKTIGHKGQNILVIGQVLRNNKDTTRFRDLQTNQNIYVNTPGVDFYKDLLKYLMTLTKRPIVFRPRAGHGLWENFNGIHLSTLDTPIEHDLRNTYVAINLTSRASIDAVIEGVPVISLSSYDAIWELSEHSLSNIENPRIFTEDERRKLLNKVSWLQWTRPDFLKGHPFRQLSIYEELQQ